METQPTDTLPAKEAADEIIRLRQRLQQCEAELQLFLYTVSHDLRNPLIAIEGLATLLESEGGEILTAELRDYAQRIARLASGLLEKIQGLLELSRASRGEAPVEPISFGELVEEVQTEIKQLFPQRVIEYHLSEHWPPVRGPRERLRRVLTQLVHNAVKFVPADRTPRVVIQAQTLPGVVEVCIEDNGSGIPAAQQQRIFEPFYRLQPELPGLGLGLAMVRRLVHGWGGTLEVQSEPGRGSRFIFTVPQPGKVDEQTL